MTLVFFKAMRPFDKTNGFFENYYWINGIAGPMSVREAQRLNSAMGGLIVTAQLPKVKDFAQMLEMLEVDQETLDQIRHRPGMEKKGKTLPEIAGPLEGDNDPEKLIRDHLDANPKPPFERHDGSKDHPERPDRPEKEVMPTGVILEMEKGGLEALAATQGIEIPAYALQFKELTDAKNDGSFNYTEHIGASKNSLAILRAFMLKKLSE